MGSDLADGLGEEFGESNPNKLARLQEEHCAPWGARLAWFPLGRKEYNGRVERSHRTDAEEFYIPFHGKIRREEDLLRKGVSALHLGPGECGLDVQGW